MGDADLRRASELAIYRLTKHELPGPGKDAQLVMQPRRPTHSLRDRLLGRRIFVAIHGVAACEILLTSRSASRDGPLKPIGHDRSQRRLSRPLVGGIPGATDPVTELKRLAGHLTMLDRNWPGQNRNETHAKNNVVAMRDERECPNQETYAAAFAAPIFVDGQPFAT
jgi:hypothetical protein